MTWSVDWATRWHDFYIDLGTANTLVMTRDRGLIVNEPSVISYREVRGRKSVVAVGNQAKINIGRNPEGLYTSFPLKNGVIADSDVTEAMLRYFLTRAKGPLRFLRPRMTVSIPFGVSGVEKSAVKEAALAAGARDVVLVDEPMLAAIGSGLPVEAPQGNMVIDIGGGTTEVAVISLYGIVHCEAVRAGGHAFDQAIIDFMRNEYNLIVGEQSAERVKIEIGSALPGDLKTRAWIRGLDFATNLPKQVIVTSDSIHAAIRQPLNEIIEAAKRTLEVTPPDLIPDILKDGITVAGGGALLKGLSQRFQEELKVPVHVTNNPLIALARGGEQIIRNPYLMERIALG